MDTFTLPSNVTLAEARGLLARLPAAPARVDAGAVQVLDSAAIALLIEASRRAAAAGRPLAIDHAPPRLRALAALYGVASLLRFEPEGGDGAASASATSPAGVPT